MDDDTSVERSPDDERLAELEAWTKAALEAWTKAVRPTLDALRAIRDGRLYRDRFASFDDYCRCRWQLDPGLVAALIDMADASDDSESG